MICGDIILKSLDLRAARCTNSLSDPACRNDRDFGYAEIMYDRPQYNLQKTYSMPVVQPLKKMRGQVLGSLPLVELSTDPPSIPRHFLLLAL